MGRKHENDILPHVSAVGVIDHVDLVMNDTSEVSVDIHIEMKEGGGCSGFGRDLFLSVEGVLQNLGRHDEHVGFGIQLNISREEPDAEVRKLLGKFVIFLIGQGLYG
jgi:hypothetical protein